MTIADRQRVQTSFAHAERLGEIVALNFFQHLFTSAPELRPLFEGNIHAQGRKLCQILKFIVEGLDEWGTLVPVLQSMGRRSARGGFPDHAYPEVQAALLRALESSLGVSFTSADRLAWETLGAALTSTMTSAAACMREGGYQTTLLAKPKASQVEP